LGLPFFWHRKEVLQTPYHHHTPQPYLYNYFIMLFTLSSDFYPAGKNLIEGNPSTLKREASSVYTVASTLATLTSP
jgi:hypothetical protein